MAQVIARDLFAGEPASLELALQRRKDLQGRDGFDEIVVDAFTDGPGHQVFGFALGDHDHRYVVADLLDALERLEPAHTRHHLVEQDRVVVVLFQHGERVPPVGDTFDLVLALGEINGMRTKFVDVIVNPQNLEGHW